MMFIDRCTVGSLSETTGLPVLPISALCASLTASWPPPASDPASWPSAFAMKVPSLLVAFGAEASLPVVLLCVANSVFAIRPAPRSSSSRDIATERAPLLAS